MASPSITETARRFWGGGSLPQVDLVLTDPPYGVSMDKGFSGGAAFGGGPGLQIERKHYPDCWDSERPSKEVFDLIQKAGRQIIIWGGNFFADLLPASTHWISWDKQNTMPTFGDCELAWTNFDRKSVKKVLVPWNGLIGKEETREHPTQKPLSLMVWCIGHSKNPQSILDPYMGSGTTLVAAKQLGRQCIGIEREEKYCEIAARRLSQGCLFSFDEAA